MNFNASDLCGVSQDFLGLFEKYQKEFLRVYQTLKLREKHGVLIKCKPLSLRNQNTKEAIMHYCNDFIPFAKKAFKVYLNSVNDYISKLNIKKDTVLLWMRFINDISDSNSDFCILPEIPLDETTMKWFELNRKAFLQSFTNDDGHLSESEYQDIIKSVPENLQQAESFDMLLKRHLQELSCFCKHVQQAYGIISRLLAGISEQEDLLEPLTIGFNLKSSYEINTLHNFIIYIEAISNIIRSCEINFVDENTQDNIRKAVSCAQNILAQSLIL